MSETSGGFFLRSTTGKVLSVPEHFKYLEIRSEDGMVSHVFALEESSLIMFTKKDPEASKYKGAFPDVKFCDAIDPPH